MTDGVKLGSLLGGNDEIRPCGASQLFVAARRSSRDDNRVWLCALGRGQVLTATGHPTLSMGVFWIPAKDVLAYEKRGDGTRLMQQIREHYGHLGNVYIVHKKLAEQLTSEMRKCDVRILI